MLGNKIVDIINNSNLSESEILIEHNGKIKRLDGFKVFGNNLILSAQKEEFDVNLKEYYSNWYKVIPYKNVNEAMLTNEVFVLKTNGQVIPLSSMNISQMIEEQNNGSLFGTKNSF